MRKYTYKRTDEEIATALVKAKGIVTDTATLLNLNSVQSLRERIKNTPALQEIREQQREIMKDSAEAVVQNSIIADKNIETAKWYLRFMAKDRGYGDSVNLTGNLKVETKVDMSKLTEKELLELENILRKTSITDSNSGTS